MACEFSYFYVILNNRRLSTVDLYFLLLEGFDVVQVPNKQIIIGDTHKKVCMSYVIDVVNS